MNDIERTLALLGTEGQTFELRIPEAMGRTGRTDSGYFNIAARLAKSIQPYDGKSPAIYVTINPVDPALKARADNRVREWSKTATADKEITRRSTLLIDCDPVRPAGISSTEAEHAAALERTAAIRDWLASQGWPEPIYADSGNGGHLDYAINLPNDSESTELVKRVLMALAERFDDEQVKVDQGVYNAARISKLYGTMACKGDSTTDRPHRRSCILSAPEYLQAVNREQLTALAALAPTAEQKPVAPVHPSENGYKDTVSAVKAAFGPDRMVDYAVAQFGGAAKPEGKETRITGQGGMHINRDNATWAVGGQPGKGGDCIDLVGYHRFGDGWDRRNVEQFKAALHQAADYVGVTLPESTKRPDRSKSPALRIVPAGEPLEPPEPAAPRFVLTHTREVLTRPKPIWLYQTEIPSNSLITLTGPSGSGKTFVAIDYALTIAREHKVIYVAAERPYAALMRGNAWLDHHKATDDNLAWIEQAPTLTDPADVQALTAAIKAFGAAFVVIDTFSRCADGIDEDSNSQVKRVMQTLDNLRRDTGAAVMVVHHTGWAGGRERGASAMRDYAEVAILVEKDADSSIRITCNKMSAADEFEPRKMRIIADGDQALVIPADDVTQTTDDKLTPAQLRVLEALALETFAEDGARAAVLIKTAGIPEGSAYRVFSALKRLNYLRQAKGGDPYFITDLGKKKLSELSRYHHDSNDTPAQTSHQKLSIAITPLRGDSDDSSDGSANSESQRMTIPEIRLCALKHKWAESRVNDLEKELTGKSPLAPVTGDALAALYNALPPDEQSRFNRGLGPVLSMRMQDVLEKDAV